MKKRPAASTAAAAPAAPQKRRLSKEPELAPQLKRPASANSAPQSPLLKKPAAEPESPLLKKPAAEPESPLLKKPAAEPEALVLKKPAQAGPKYKVCPHWVPPGTRIKLLIDATFKWDDGSVINLKAGDKGTIAYWNYKWTPLPKGTVHVRWDDNYNQGVRFARIECKYIAPVSEKAMENPHHPEYHLGSYNMPCKCGVLHSVETSVFPSDCAYWIEETKKHISNDVIALSMQSFGAIAEWTTLLSRTRFDANAEELEENKQNELAMHAAANKELEDNLVAKSSQVQRHARENADIDDSNAEKRLGYEQRQQEVRSAVQRMDQEMVDKGYVVNTRALGAATVDLARAQMLEQQEQQRGRGRGRGGPRPRTSPVFGSDDIPQKGKDFEDGEVGSPTGSPLSIPTSEDEGSGNDYQVGGRPRAQAKGKARVQPARRPPARAPAPVPRVAAPQPKAAQAKMASRARQMMGARGRRGAVQAPVEHYCNGEGCKNNSRLTTSGHYEPLDGLWYCTQCWTNIGFPAGPPNQAFYRANNPGSYLYTENLPPEWFVEEEEPQGYYSTASSSNAPAPRVPVQTAAKSAPRRGRPALSSGARSPRPKAAAAPALPKAAASPKRGAMQGAMQTTVNPVLGGGKNKDTMIAEARAERTVLDDEEQNLPPSPYGADDADASDDETEGGRDGEDQDDMLGKEKEAKLEGEVAFYPEDLVEESRQQEALIAAEKAGKTP